MEYNTATKMNGLESHLTTRLNFKKHKVKQKKPVTKECILYYLFKGLHCLGIHSYSLKAIFWKKQVIYYQKLQDNIYL